MHKTSINREKNKKSLDYMLLSQLIEHGVLSIELMVLYINDIFKKEVLYKDTNRTEFLKEFVTAIEKNDSEVLEIKTKSVVAQKNDSCLI